MIEALFTLSKEEAMAYLPKVKNTPWCFLLSSSLITHCEDRVLAVENCQMWDTSEFVYNTLSRTHKPLCAVIIKDTGRSSCHLEWQHTLPPKEWPGGTYFLLESLPPQGAVREWIKVIWLSIPLCTFLKSLFYAHLKNRFKKSVWNLPTEFFKHHHRPSRYRDYDSD